jgi:hypothetical protein
MANQEELRVLIRAQILSGRLPRSTGLQVYSGKGDGGACVCCANSITRAQVQYDVQLSRRGGEAASLSVHFHCYHAWHDVVAELRAQDAPSPDEARPVG